MYYSKPRRVKEIYNGIGLMRTEFIASKRLLYMLVVRLRHTGFSSAF